MSEQEYLAFEGNLKIKHEYMDGEIFRYGWRSTIPTV